MTDFYRQLCCLIDSGEDCALAIVVSAKGSTPQRAGAKAIFTADGRIFGTLGGGCLEAESRQRALRALQTGERQLFKLVLDDDFGWDDGLICGGAVEIFVDPRPTQNLEAWRALSLPVTERRWLRVNLDSGMTILDIVGRVPLLGEGSRANPQTPRGVARPIKTNSEYIEPIFPKEKLIIAGAGHIGAALCKLAASLCFEVTVIDDRASFANRERLPDATRIIVDDPAKAIAALQIDEETYVSIVTRGHRNDAVVLREVIGKPAAYIGMIGSKRKVRVIFEEFLEQGVATETQLKRVHSPMGIHIGSESVNEIAVSIAAELIQVRAQRREG